MLGEKAGHIVDASVHHDPDAVLSAPMSDVHTADGEGRVYLFVIVRSHIFDRVGL